MIRVSFLFLIEETYAFVKLYFRSKGKKNLEVFCFLVVVLNWLLASVTIKCHFATLLGTIKLPTL